MSEIRVDGFKAYQRCLIDNVSEQAALARRIFINHTQFFRDTSVWQELAFDTVARRVFREARGRSYTYVVCRLRHRRRGL
jgi:chemotaxis methyl-accepting protein methylase